jgi:hypothetical protein
MQIENKHLALTLIALLFLMTDCEKKMEHEVTLRQDAVVGTTNVPLPRRFNFP